MALTTKKPTRATKLSFAAMGDGLTFLTPPLAQETEITGPSALKLVASSSTADADFFIVLRVFTGDMKEIVFQGAIDPHTPDCARLAARLAPQARQEAVAALPALSHPRREAAAEERPAGRARHRDLADLIVVPAGYRIGLSVRGKDYEYGGGSGGKLSNFKNELTGCGPFLHDDPRDRPPAIFDNTTTLHFGRAKMPYLLLPIIPPKRQAAAKKPRSKKARRR